MLSNDIKTLSAGTGTYAAILNVQGKILADVRLFCVEEAFLIDLPGRLKDTILDHLNRHLVADEVEIEDLTERFGMISIQGPMAGAPLRAVLHRDLPAQPLSHSPFELAGHKVRVARATHTGEDGYDLSAAVGELHDVVSLIEKAFDSPPVWVGAEAQEILRVEAGIPRYGIDMDEDNLLLETGLESHVSFHKGCYLGQEVVERIRSRGHVNKKLTGIVLEGSDPAERGGRIYSGEKEIGAVTSSVMSPHLNAPIALAYVHRDFSDPGTPVVWRQGEKIVQGKIAALPFYQSPSRPA
jgi:folate-binding protein YgfZ